MEKDTRWIQRFENFKKALENLGEAVALAEKRKLSHLEKQGLIHAFEITYDLGWNTIRDYYQSQGESKLKGSRNVFKVAADRGLVEANDLFTRIIKSRQLTVFSLNEETAGAIAADIIDEYYAAFRRLRSKLEEKSDENP